MRGYKMSKEVKITRNIISTYLINCGIDEGYKEGLIIAAKLDEKLFLEHVKALIEIFTKAKEELERWQSE